jgi:hypothetical protein
MLCNQTGFWAACSFSPMSVKDRLLLVPLVMLNACFTFSWPNKLPFDCKASGTIRAEIYMGAHIGADEGMIGARKVSPRAGMARFLAVGRSLGIAAPVCPATFIEILSLVTYSSLDW